jgi:hypothetical protein
MAGALAAQPVVPLAIAHLLIDTDVPARRVAEILNGATGRSEWTERRVYGVVEQLVRRAAQTMWFLELGFDGPAPTRIREVQTRVAGAALREMGVVGLVDVSQRGQAARARGRQESGDGYPIAARLVRWYLQGASPGGYEDLRREFGPHVPSRAALAAERARREITAVLLANGDGCGGILALAELSREAIAPTRQPEGEFVTVDLAGVADSFDSASAPPGVDVEALGEVPFRGGPTGACALTVRHPRIVVPVDVVGAGYAHLLLCGSYAKGIWRDARLGTLIVSYSAGLPDRVPLWLGHNFRNDNIADPECVGETSSPWTREVARWVNPARGEAYVRDMMTAPLDPRRRLVGIEIQSHARARTGDAWPFFCLSGLTIETGRHPAAPGSV